MNVFLPQSLQTQVELEEIAAVERQLIDPGNSKTVMGIVQDGLLGAYNLTNPTVRIDWRNAMNIMSYTSLEDFSHIKKDKDYTGSELFSLIVPPGINMQKGSLKIKNGKIIEGRLSKDALGAKKKNNLVQLIWDAYGVEETRKFLDNTQRLVNNFNLWNGFSVGMADTVVPPSVYDEIEKKFQSQELKIEHIITEMENNPNLMKKELYELRLFSEMNIIRDDVSKLIMSNLSSTNSFQIMSSSGSKGDPTNSGQMCGCLGLQVFEGKIMPKKYNGRTLAYFHQHDDRGPSRGLVKQSFIRGLEYPQYVFHLMASRLGIIEQAITTAETGYAQRKLVKSMEDIMIKYDNTVRSANNGIIQFVYGDSGADTGKQYEYIIKMVESNNQELENKHKFTSQELKNVKGFTESDNEKLYKDIISMRDHIRETVRRAKMNYIVLTNTFMIPINLNRIIDTIAGSDLKSTDSLTPQYIIQQLENLLSNTMTTIICMSNNERNDNNSFKNKDERLHKVVFRTALYDSLSPKKVLLERQLNKKQFDSIISEISTSFNKNMIEPGEMAGVISAQSTGEPLTQMSVHKNEQIIIRKISTGEIYYGKIGEYLDNILEKNKESLLKLQHKDSVALDTEDYEIISVSNKEKVSWTKISQISRHPSNGKLIKITTKTGRTITTTMSHSHLKRTVNSIEPINGSDLKVGHRIPLVKNMSECQSPSTEIQIGNIDIKLNHDFGWLCGAYLADGSINGNTITITKATSEIQQKIIKLAELIFNTKATIIKGTEEDHLSDNIVFSHKEYADFLKLKFGDESHKKNISGFIFGTNKQFIAGIISGYFDVNGNIQFDDKNHCNIRVSSRSKELINSISILCSFFGIFGYLSEQTLKSDLEKVQHNFSIQKEYVNVFLEEISLSVNDMIKSLKERFELNNEDKNNTANFDNMIPELGTTIALIEKELKLSEVNKNYERLIKNEAIGYNALQKYYSLFSDKIQNCDDKLTIDKLKPHMEILKQALDAEVVWDEIIEIQELEDPKEFVYDFTVPENETFMMGSGLFTHNTLNSFHHSGISTLSSQLGGVPRIKELLSTSKKPKSPSMFIYFTEEFSKSKDMAHKVASHIKHTTLGEVRSRLNVYYDPNPTAKGSIMEKDNIKQVFHHNKGSRTGCQSDISGLPWLMRIELDREKMLEKEVALLDVVSKFCSWWERRFSENKQMKKEEKKVLNKITQIAVLSNTDNDKYPVVHIRFNVKDADKDKDRFDLSTIDNFIDHIVDTFKLKGINGITDIPAIQEERALSFNSTTGDVEKNTQYVVYTSGVNLQEIRYLNGVDLTKTISNHIIEMYQTFGIEVARAVLLREIANSYEKAGGEVNYQHVSMIVDQMTATGQINSIDRHGMNKSGNDPLSRASFEKTVEQLLIAAVYAETDHMRGVSSRIMAGAVVEGGTGYCQLELDTDMIEKSEYLESSEQTKKFTELNKGTLADDIINKKEKKNIFVPV